MRPADPVDLPGVRTAHDPQQEFVPCRRIRGQVLRQEVRSLRRPAAHHHAPHPGVTRRHQRSPRFRGLRGSSGDVLDAARGELVAQAVQVQAQLAVGQGLAVLLLLGHPRPRGRQRLANIGAWHAYHAVVVGDDRVTRPDDLPADRDGQVDRARRLLDRALGADRCRPDTEAHRSQFGHVPDTGLDDQATDPARGQRGRQQLTEHPVGARRGRRDHQQVPGLALFHRRVDHEVVAGPAQRGDRGPADSGSGLDGAQARAEVPGPADRLVHGGHPKCGQLVHDAQVGAGRPGDDHVAHQLSLSVTCGNTRM